MARDPSAVVGLRATEPLELVPGVAMRPLFGEGAMLNLLELEPGAHVPVHDHPHEQLGYVIEGVLLLEIDGVEHELHPGDAFRIDGGTPHGARAVEKCVALDVFQPVREDYRKKAGL